MRHRGGVEMRSFLGQEKPMLTAMVQANNPERIKRLIDGALIDGADAFGMQTEQLLPEYRNEKIYRGLFAYTADKPVYATNYRYAQNKGKSDDCLAEELLTLAKCGADLCDVMGDIYDRQAEEITYNADAVEKQKQLIDRLHGAGAKVLMSSHVASDASENRVLKFLPAERVLEIAHEHQKRGADISKIVTYANNTEEQIENLRIINLLKKELEIPFLFLCGGECRLLRRIGGQLGCCMYLCVHEYDDFATKEQPLITDVKAVRDIIGM